MILTIDVGNTHTIIGAYKDDKLNFTSRISTDIHKTGDEYAVAISSVLSLHKIDDNIEGAIISSVVPQVSHQLENAIKTLLVAACLLSDRGLRRDLTSK